MPENHQFQYTSRAKWPHNRAAFGVFRCFILVCRKFRLDLQIFETLSLTARYLRIEQRFGIFRFSTKGARERDCIEKERVLHASRRRHGS